MPFGMASNRRPFYTKKIMPGTGAGFPVNFYPPATRVMLAPSISRYSEMPPNKWIWKNALKRVNYGFGNHSKPFTSECDSEPGWCGDPSNLCFFAMHGYEVYELQGLLILDPINPEEVESYKAEHARILKSEKHQPVLSFRKKMY